jgi:hypothetical protein
VEVVPDVRMVKQPDLGLVGLAYIALVTALINEVDQELLAVAPHLFIEVCLESSALEVHKHRLKKRNKRANPRTEPDLPQTGNAARRAWA